jgi:pSer/pThr/pTyr-binding forkhead associated (FHA) protein
MRKILILNAVSSSHYGKRHTIEMRSMSLGSATNNDIVVQDRSIAPRHAEFRQILDRWFVLPLAPGEGGISINGMPITGQSRLNHGDRLTIGNVTYQTVLAEVEERSFGSAVSSQSNLPRLGEYLVRRGLMTGEQAARTARRQDEILRTGRNLQFGQVALEMGYISRSQLDAVLADQRADFNRRFND